MYVIRGIDTKKGEAVKLRILFVNRTNQTLIDETCLFNFLLYFCAVHKNTGVMFIRFTLSHP